MSSNSNKLSELSELELGLIVATGFFTIIRVFQSEFPDYNVDELGFFLPQPNLQVYGIVLFLLILAALYLPANIIKQLTYTRIVADQGVLLSVILLPCILLTQFVALNQIISGFVTILWLTICCSILTLLSYFQQINILNFRNNSYILTCALLLFASITEVFKSNNSMFVSTLLILIIYPEVYNYLARLLQKSFSAGELVLISQLFSILIINALLQLIANIVIYIGLPEQWTDFAIQTVPIYSVNPVALAGEIICVAIFILGALWKLWLTECYTHYMAAQNNDKKLIANITKLITRASLRANIAFIMIIICILEPIIWIFIGSEPFTWVYQYLMGEPTLKTIFPQLPNGIRMIFVIEFLIVITISVFFAPAGKRETQDTVSTSAIKNPPQNSNTKNTIKPSLTTIPNIIIRKYYHVLVVLLFTPAILMEPEFMSLGFAVGLSLFILLEYIRFVRLAPFGSIIHKFMSPYIDSRDSGLVILTHTYLLLGCALPVWLHSWIYKQQLTQIQFKENAMPIHTLFSYLPVLSGIISLGLGDTAASVFGIFYGKHKWPNSKKTIEGTIGMALSMLIFIIGLQQSINFILNNFSSFAVDYSSNYNWLCVIFSVIFSCLFEAFTVQIDNLYLPLFYYLWMLLLY